MNILAGSVIGISGDAKYYGGGQVQTDVTLSVRVTFGEICNDFPVHLGNVFDTREALVDRIINGYGPQNAG